MEQQGTKDIIKELHAIDQAFVRGMLVISDCQQLPQSLIQYIMSRQTVRKKWIREIAPLYHE